MWEGEGRGEGGWALKQGMRRNDNKAQGKGRTERQPRVEVRQGKSVPEDEFVISWTEDGQPWKNDMEEMKTRQTEAKHDKDC